jgi:hypothetical protein
MVPLRAAPYWSMEPNDPTRAAWTWSARTALWPDG